MNTRAFPSIPRDGLILILGLGETGLAAALWCAAGGARLRVLDTRDEPGALAALREQLADDVRIDYRLGAQALADEALLDVGLIVISPGLSPLHEPIRSFLALAAQRRIEVVGEIELFARALTDMAAQGYRPAVLAVTGTNGKTTVTAMTRQLIQASGRSVRAVGNIGPAALAALRECVASNDLPDVWVLELSSFQLETTHSLTPAAAVVLNLSQDHLDWHGSAKAYAQAKASLLQMADIAIVNRDDAQVAAMVPDLTAPNVRSFGRTAPVVQADLGIDDSQGIQWLAAAEPADLPAPSRLGRAKKATPSQRPPGQLTRLMPVDALRVRGGHNALNALAALGLARALGLSWSGMLHALRDYPGEPDRGEFVRSLAGIDFVNDSKGTNVGATVAALEGLERTSILIAGGLGKGQDFSPLAPAVGAHARAVVLIGADAPIIEQALAATDVPVERTATLEQAVALAFSLARQGDVVLLSPACASMDMFSNYRQRGAAFIDAVRELALAKGEPA